MPVFSRITKSGASLIILALLQVQLSYAAEIPRQNSETSQPGSEAKTEPALGTAAAASASASAASASAATEQAVAFLECRYFEHDFHSDTMSDRLLRLEQLLFGEEKPGSISERLKAVQTVANKTNEDKKQAAAAGKSAGSSTNDAVKPKISFNSALNAGIADFKAQRYHHAQDEFEQAVSLNPRSPEAYANLAGALLMLRDRQGAQDAFKACYSLQPFGKLGTYAREQLLKLARDEAYEKTDPQDSTTTVARTIKTINRQTADLSRTDQARAQRMADYRINLANIEIAKLTSDTEAALADLRARHNYTTVGNNGVLHYHRGGAYLDPYGRQEISNMNYIKTNYLRTDGQVQANLALLDGYKRSGEVYDSGTSLKEQILQPVQPGGAKLRALGTSLYARYYGNGTPSLDDPVMVDPPPAGLEAKAKSMSISK